MRLFCWTIQNLQVALLASIAITSSSIDVFAAPPPAGDEFQINTYTSGDQRAWPEAPGSVAMDADGNFVVVWGSSSQDGSDTGVYGQRFNADGEKQGDEFLVNTTTTGAQRYPTVAMDASGNFVVTWTSADSSGTGIFAQRFNASGQKQGGEFPVNTTTANDQKWSVVAMNSSGAFIVTWTSLNSGTPYPDVYARRFNSSGAGQGNDFVVANSYTDLVEGEHGFIFPSTAIDDDGNFVVAYSEYTSQTYNRLLVKRYESSGSLLGTTLVIERVPPDPTEEYRHSFVDMDADGNFVVVWTQLESLIRAKRFSLAGAELTDFIDVYASGDDFSLFPRVALDEDGNFVVCWDRQDSQNYYDVYARAYTAAGEPTSDSFPVNSATTNNQQFSSIAMAPNGDYVVVWTAYNNQDGSNAGMFGQRYAEGSVTGCPIERLVRESQRLLRQGPFERLLQQVALSPRELDDLRRFRDQILNKNADGRELVEAYYSHGPLLAVAAIRRPDLLIEGVQLLREAHQAVTDPNTADGRIVLSQSTFERGLRWVYKLSSSLSVRNQHQIREAKQILLKLSTTEGKVTTLHFDEMDDID